MKKNILSVVLLLTLTITTPAIAMREETKIFNMKNIHSNEEHQQNIEKIIHQEVIKVPDLYDIITNFNQKNKNIFKKIFFNLFKGIIVRLDLNFNKPLTDDKNLDIISKLDPTNILKLEYNQKNVWNIIDNLHEKFITISKQMKKDDITNKISFILDEPNFDYIVKNDLLLDVLQLDIDAKNEQSFCSVFPVFEKIMKLEQLSTKLIKKLVLMTIYLQKFPFYSIDEYGQEPALETLYLMVEEDAVLKDFLILAQFTANLKEIYEKIKNNMIDFIGREIAIKNEISVKKIRENFHEYLELFKIYSTSFFKKYPEIFKEQFVNIYFDDSNRLSRSFLAVSILNDRKNVNPCCCS